MITPGRGRRLDDPFVGALDDPFVGILAARSGMITPGRGRRLDDPFVGALDDPFVGILAHVLISAIPSQIPMLRIALRVRLRASPFAQDDNEGVGVGALATPLP
ncbi:MAG: hypothetical protein E7663_04535 [Ruminococcaceae bacterium]|nr:hypothetical protein [Oscillospiraceae bacterium]